jgi:hypothetical protein
MEKRSKKSWTWKYKFWRKKRSSHCGRGVYKSASKAYYHKWIEAARAQERNMIANLINVDFDDSMLEFPKRHRHVADWDYW